MELYRSASRVYVGHRKHAYVSGATEARDGSELQACVSVSVQQLAPRLWEYGAYQGQVY